MKKVAIHFDSRPKMMNGCGVPHDHGTSCRDTLLALILGRGKQMGLRNIRYSGDGCPWRAMYVYKSLILCAWSSNDPIRCVHFEVVVRMVRRTA
eukprot:scaffold36_cov127-Cylindrotheca_fusiformis.AAC.3